ncbi:hypothetical protein [Nocardia australiensis]|uniref:hypothetical protein n=1 Tax=Nocardia australiensis TaxID=2887191 RepID=UPI001D13BFB9|nr:hypothetical protein [Nocardia australiensis]
MASGDGSADDGDGADFSGDPPFSDAGDTPPYRPSGIDPSVEPVWLRRRSPRPRRYPTLPRLSTIMLLGAFVAALVLYTVLRAHG